MHVLRHEAQAIIYRGNILHLINGEICVAKYIYRGNISHLINGEICVPIYNNAKFASIYNRFNISPLTNGEICVPICIYRA